eukprot:3854763-Amphidinium_carterae.1
MQLTRWIKKQISKKGSPLYKWPRAEVREAVDRHRKSAEGPPLLREYPLCLKDLAAWMAPLLTMLLPMLLNTSL